MDGAGANLFWVLGPSAEFSLKPQRSGLGVRVRAEHVLLAFASIHRAHPCDGRHCRTFLELHMPKVRTVVMTVVFAGASWRLVYIKC